VNVRFLPSLPGLAVRRTGSLPLAYARQSIFKKLSFLMDARVKPAHDEVRWVCWTLAV
jgi:hypothetical protein